MQNAKRPKRLSAIRMMVAAANEVAECPDGQEYPPGVCIKSRPHGWTTNGLGRPIIGFNIWLSTCERASEKNSMSANGLVILLYPK
jgi:hypothetical protein